MGRIGDGENAAALRRGLLGSPLQKQPAQTPNATALRRGLLRSLLV
ncbi:MAG TPA: hypothetical protein VKB46_07835 [Pyrinomonadaceae bacterium]|nr:hypothetical protein [Pyrinomonadaceae bacterium]